MSYDKFAGVVPRILVFESKYWLDVASARAAAALGWEVRAVPVVMEGALPRKGLATLFETLVDFRPDFVLTINLGGMDVDGLIAHVLSELRVPHVTWFVDNPRTILMDRPIYGGDHSVALTWDAAYCRYLSDMGFPKVLHAPLAADLTLFNAVPSSAWSLPPSFVGDSNSTFATAAWNRLAKLPLLASAVSQALDAGRVTRQALSGGIRSILEPSLVDCLTPDERRLAELYLICEGTRRHRVDWVRRLEPEGIRVMGDPMWGELCGCADPAVDYETRLPHVYANSVINLNTTSLQMPSTVNQRVFDCPAAGGFLLTDAQTGLTGLFDVPGEMVTYSSTEECIDLLRHFLNRPEERMAIANRGRRRILAEHTYMHRLADIAARLKERFAT